MPITQQLKVSKLHVLQLKSLSSLSATGAKDGWKHTRQQSDTKNRTKSWKYPSATH